MCICLQCQHEEGGWIKPWILIWIYPSVRPI